MECMYCKSIKTVKDIRVGLQNEAGFVGLEHKKGIFVQTEAMLAELCQDCGSIIRLYVEDTSKQWYIKK